MGDQWSYFIPTLDLPQQPYFSISVSEHAITDTMVIDLFTDTAAILNSEEIMGCPGGRWEIIKKNTVAW